MIGHLSGPRISALLDGQLSTAESERAWTHVHHCHACRDLVEREGWIKSRLAGLSSPDPLAPPDLVGLLAACETPTATPAPVPTSGTRVWGSMTVLGGTAVGAVMVGVVALGVGAPTTSIEQRTVRPTPAGGTATPAVTVPTQVVGLIGPQAPKPQKNTGKLPASGQKSELSEVAFHARSVTAGVTGVKIAQ